MKKFIFSIFVFFAGTYNVFADYKYQVRSDDDYGVPSYVEVTDSNREAVLSTPLVDSRDKIYDIAGKISTSDVRKLYKVVNGYINSCNMDMVIVTINDNPKDSATVYGQDFYDYNTFGISDSHDGILLLYDFYYNRVSIVTTGRANDMYNNRRIGELKKVISGDIKNSYYEASVSFVDKALSFCELGYPLKDGSEPRKTGINLLKSLPWSGILAFSLMITIILIIFLIQSKKTVISNDSYQKYLVKNKLKLEISEDNFIDKTLDKTNKI